MLNDNEVNSLCMGCMSFVEDKERPCPYCGWLDSEYSHPIHQLPPQTILNGKYLVGRVLGEGGFGITYLGWDLNLNMKIAIKEYYPSGFVTRETTATTTITPFSGDKKEAYLNGLNKFVVEARSLAKFYNLPGIVSVRDFFKENGTAYIVMEYIEGITLKQYMIDQGGRLPARDVLELVESLIRSLSRMHAEGIIHRDISPDNIMLTRNGEVKLLDFGAARSVSSDGAKSLSVLLKPGYAPEEQYRSRGNQGPWTDVYALCATIYKVITGETPPEALERMHADTLIPPSQMGADLTESQEKALLKGMAVLQNDRYDNIASLYADLYGNQLDTDIPNTETDRIKARSNFPSGKQDLGTDKTMPLDADSDRTVPLSDNGMTIPLDRNRTVPLDKSAPSPSGAPIAYKSGRVASLIILALYSIGAFLMYNFEADLILWIIAAADAAYTLYRLIKNGSSGLAERLAAIGARCGLALLLIIKYLGDNSRAFGYGRFPDPGFTVGYGPVIVLIVLLLGNAGYEAADLIRWFKSTSVTLSRKKIPGALKFTGIVAVVSTFIIFALTLSFVVEDVMWEYRLRESKYDNIRTGSDEPDPPIGAEPSDTPVSKPSEKPTPTDEEIPSPTPIPSGEPAAPSEAPVTGSKDLGNSPAKYAVSSYPADYSTDDYASTNFKVFGDWLYYIAGSGELFREQVDPDNIDSGERYAFLAGEGNPLIELVLDGPVQSFVICKDPASKKDYMYFIEGSRPYTVFCRANPDGTDKREIFRGDFVRIIIDQGWLYFTDLSDGNKLWRVKLDGSEPEMILDQQWDFGMIAFVYDNWVYFHGGNGEIYRVRSDGEYLAPFSSNIDFPYWVKSGYLYYNSIDDDGFYRMRPDGSDKKRISDRDGQFMLAGDWIYCYSQSGTYRIRLDGSNKEILSYSYYWYNDGFRIYPSENHDIMYYFDDIGAGCYKIETVN